ncbi:MAG: hypothetical protein JW388_1330 [Nitrospira sp.]|nr:hypothetical protein [Nitrospira sp.]
MCLARTHSLKSAFAEESEQFDLHAGVNLANLIEKQRAALRLFEAADAPFDGAGERALLVAEQLAFQQRRRERSAVNGHHRRTRTRAELVNGFGDEFFSRATFAENEDAGARGSDLPHDLKNPLHGSGFADDVVEAKFRIKLLMKLPVFHFEITRPQRTRNAQLQFVDLQPAFGNVIVGAVLHGVHGHLLRSVRGHQNASGRLGLRLDLADQLESVIAGKAQVREHGVEPFFGEQLSGRSGIGRGVDFVSIFKRGAEAVARRLLVVHDEENGFVHDQLLSRSGWRRGAGSQTRKVVPRPASLRISIRPPCSRTMRWTIINPRPVPCCLVV